MTNKKNGQIEVGKGISLRLGKRHPDIEQIVYILNEKKAQNVEINAYILDCIRAFEGIQTPLTSKPVMKAPAIDHDAIVDQVIEKLMRSGQLMQGQLSNTADVPLENEEGNKVSEQTKEQMKDIISGVISFGDDDDDDDD